MGAGSKILQHPHDRASAEAGRAPVGESLGDADARGHCIDRRLDRIDADARVDRHVECAIARGREGPGPISIHAVEGDARQVRELRRHLRRAASGEEVQAGDCDPADVADVNQCDVAAVGFAVDEFFGDTLRAGQDRLHGLRPRPRWLRRPASGLCSWAPSDPLAHRPSPPARAIWRLSSGSVRTRRQGSGYSLSKLGARLEYAVLCGRCREERLPQAILLLTCQD